MNNIKNRTIIFTLFLLMCSVTVFAKRYYTSRERPDWFMVHLTPGISLLDYQSPDSRSRIAPTIGAGVEYAHFFGLHFGLSAGAEITSFNAYYRFDNRRDSLQQFDNYSSRYYMLRQQLNTTEYQSVTYLSLPVKLQFRMLFNSKLVFHASAGIAYTLYMGEHRSIVSNTVDRQAFFSDINVTVDDFAPLNFGKFKTFINPSPEQQFDKSLLAIAQTGFSLRVAQNWNVSTELNFQYGLDQIKNRSINLLVPNEYAGVTATNYISNIRPVSLGVRIGLAYTFDLFNVDCKCHNPLF